MLMSQEVKKYFFFNGDIGEPVIATWTEGNVTIRYSDTIETVITDTGEGYAIAETSPAWKEAKITLLDYSLTADIFAALKIFNQNSDSGEGEYWTVFQGEKL